MAEKTIEQLTHEAFEEIKQFIAQGATPRERAARALWTARTLLAREPSINEEWGIAEEARREESHATR